MTTRAEHTIPNEEYEGEPVIRRFSALQLKNRVSDAGSTTKGKQQGNDISAGQGRGQVNIPSISSRQIGKGLGLGSLASQHDGTAAVFLFAQVQTTTH